MKFAIESKDGETLECCFKSADNALQKAKQYDQETSVKEVNTK